MNLKNNDNDIAPASFKIYQLSGDRETFQVDKLWIW